MKTHYTEEEKSKLKKAFNLVLDDISELWSKANYDEELIVNLSVLETYHWPLYKFGISIKKIWCNCYGDGPDKIIFEKRNVFGKVIRPPLNDYDIMYTFLNIYEGIRGLVQEEVHAILHGNQDFKEVDSILKKYDKEASIEVDVPMQNQQQLKVSRENGKTVGVLDFGDRTIKVITNGAIVLVNKNDEELERIVTKRK